MQRLPMKPIEETIVLVTLHSGSTRSCGLPSAERFTPQITIRYFRGEQRAWYDTLRDFVPLVKGLCPTLRLFASEYEWCSRKPESARDVETFRQILAERVNFWKLEFSDDSSPILARVIVDGSWRGDSPTAQRLLEDICEHWPEGKKVYCLTTCGRVSALRLAAQRAINDPICLRSARLEANVP